MLRKTSELERCVLGDVSPRTEQEHLARYEYARQFVDGKEVLDIACGSGYGSSMLAGAGAKRVLGVDLSPEAIEHARQHFSAANLSFITGDAQRLEDLPDESVDVVVSFETIEHLPDDVKYLNEVHRVLRPRGWFLVSTPDRRPGPTKQRLTGKPANPVPRARVHAEGIGASARRAV